MGTPSSRAQKPPQARARKEDVSPRALRLVCAGSSHTRHTPPGPPPISPSTPPSARFSPSLPLLLATSPATLFNLNALRLRLCAATAQLTSLFYRPRPASFALQWLAWSLHQHTRSFRPPNTDSFSPQLSCFCAALFAGTHTRLNQNYANINS